MVVFFFEFVFFLFVWHPGHRSKCKSLWCHTRALLHTTSSVWLFLPLISLDCVPCLFRVVFGTLYPAYSSYKAVKSKDVKEYVSMWFLSHRETNVQQDQTDGFSCLSQVKWMMYWIIFALFTTVEVFSDMFLCWWAWPFSYFDPITRNSRRVHFKRAFLPSCFVPPSAPKWSPLFRLPFYYELKIAFVVWLLSPYTKGSSVLYRKFVHPTLSSKEKVKTLSLCRTDFLLQSMEKHFSDIRAVSREQALKFLTC